MHDSDHEQVAREGRHKDKRNKAEEKRDKDENGQKDQQVGPVSKKCPEMTQSQ